MGKITIEPNPHRIAYTKKKLSCALDFFLEYKHALMKNKLAIKNQAGYLTEIYIQLVKEDKYIELK